MQNPVMVHRSEETSGRALPGVPIFNAPAELEPTGNVAITDQDGQIKEKSDKMRFNISGNRFVCNRATLQKYPNTKLAKLASIDFQPQEHFYPGSPEVFQKVLQYYLTGELHIPTNLCYSEFVEHLNYWDIEESEISLCCWQQENEETTIEKELRWLENLSKIPPKEGTPNKLYPVWLFLTEPHSQPTKLRLVLSSLYIALILLGNYMEFYTANLFVRALHGHIVSSNLSQELREVLCTMHMNITRALGSGGTPDSGVLIGPLFMALLLSSEILLLVDMILHLIATQDRRRFCRSVHVFDLIACILVLCLGSLYATLNGLEDTEQSCLIAGCIELSLIAALWLRSFRLFCVAMLFRETRIVVIAIKKSYRALVLLFLILVGTAMIGSPIIFVSNFGANRQNPIRDLYDAVWLMMTTMTTVGYGDIAPEYYYGRIFGVVMMVIGLAITSLPIAIIGSNFAQIHCVQAKIMARKTKPSAKNKRSEQPQSAKEVGSE